MSNILCITERTFGETDTNQGYQHFLEFPSMRHIKKIQNYHKDWGNGSGDGNDSGQCAYVGGRVYQVNCYADILLQYDDPMNMNHVTDYIHSSGWGPTGIAIKGNVVYLISSASAQIEVRNLDSLNIIVKTISLDITTYDEHNGLNFLSNGHMIMATKNGHIVEMDENGNYINAILLSSNAYRGSAILGGYLVICNIDTNYIYCLDINTKTTLWTYDFSSYLNAVGNVIYGSFFIKSSAIKL